MWSCVTLFAHLFLRKKKIYIFRSSSIFGKPKKFLYSHLYFTIIIIIKIIINFIIFLLLIFWIFFSHLICQLSNCLIVCSLKMKGFITCHVFLTLVYSLLTWCFWKKKMCCNNLDRLYFVIVIFMKPTNAHHNY